MSKYYKPYKEPGYFIRGDKIFLKEPGSSECLDEALKVLKEMSIFPKKKERKDQERKRKNLIHKFN